MIRHLYLCNDTVIIRFNIQNSLKCWEEELDQGRYTYVAAVASDAAAISEFYIRNGYSQYTLSTVEAEYERQNQFHAIYDGSRIVAGMWIHRGVVDVNAPSFRALKEHRNHVVCFDADTIYSSHNLVEEAYRGKRLYSMLLYNVFRYHQNDFRFYVIITGMDNKKMLNSSLHYMGQVVGYARTIRLFRRFWLRFPHFFVPLSWHSEAMNREQYSKEARDE